MDTRKVDLIIQYALAVASEAEDYRERELGPIHLLKYVYLADLGHAQSEGSSFTGADWRFHHFGPWSSAIHNRIAPAAQAIHASERRFPSRFKEDDAVRWRVQDQNLAEKLESKLPWSVARSVKQAVHKHHNDTTALLHEVYRTAPMLNAAPEEILDLNLPKEPPEKVQEATSLPVLSKNKVKKLQALVKKRLEENRQTRSLVAPDPPPRYDEVFARGQEWLDSQAGEPVQVARGRIRFSNDVWKSPGRRDPEIS